MTERFNAWPRDDVVAVAKVPLADAEFDSDGTRTTIVGEYQRRLGDTIGLLKEFLANLLRQNYIVPTRYSTPTARKQITNSVPHIYPLNLD